MFSDQSEQDFLNHNFLPGAGAYSPPAQHYISLHTGDPGDDGSNELAGYTRFLMSAPATDWNAAALRAITNATVIQFTGMPSTSLVGVGIWTAVTGGTYMAGGLLTGQPIAVSAGATVRFSAGQFSLSLPGGVYTDYLAESWLNFQFRNVSYTRPSGHNLGIYTGDPSSGGSAVAGSGQETIAFNSPVATSGRHQVSNNALITFSGLTGGDTLSYWGVQDTEGTPNLLAFRDQADLAINPGDAVEFQSGTGCIVGID